MDHPQLPSNLQIFHGVSNLQSLVLVRATLFASIVREGPITRRQVAVEAGQSRARARHALSTRQICAQIRWLSLRVYTKKI